MDSMKNHSNDSADDFADGPPLYTRLIFAGAWILIAVAGIVGNSLVIFVAIRFEKLNNVTNCFIVNLAITDIVFLAFCMPLLVVQYTLDRWYFNETFCKLLNFISFVSVLVTVLTLVAMTVDRYIYVVHPFENIRWRKPRTVFFLSSVIWLLSCVLASPFYYYYDVTEDEYRQCALATDEHLQRSFPIYLVTLYYFIPLTIILICYAKLLHYVFSKENKLRPKTKSNVVKWSKKRRAVTKMVAIVTLVFSLCWLPITLCIISAYVFERKTPFLYYFKIIGNSFAYLNSAVNPIIYAFVNRSFRANCGSILSRPTCSLFWRRSDAHPLHNKTHELENCFSAEQPNIGIVENRIHMAVNGRSNDDFSDEEFDAIDDDDLPQQGANENKLLTEVSVKQYEVSSAGTAAVVGRPLATSL